MNKKFRSNNRGCGNCGKVKKHLNDKDFLHDVRLEKMGKRTGVFHRVIAPKITFAVFFGFTGDVCA